MEELKDKIIDSVLNMFSSGKSNLRCFLTLFIIGLIIFGMTLLGQNLVVSILKLSPYWSEEYILGFNRISLGLFFINIIYLIFAITYFIKYYLSEEIWIN